ncbi:cysteine-rich receptor-like protein kinase 8 [Silene latifolia]|uniref:cysteine-rich receptor-like protein kinase 8 n=1 Tax=Silene latifolia TaxID=37657 RepID=UPI003D780EE4
MAQFSLLLIYFPILLSMIINLKPLLAANYFANDCSNTTFASNSKYQTNLNTLFQDLTSNATKCYGYYNATAGVGTNDVVYGHILCRGDQSTSSCQNCVTMATMTDLPVTYCPNKKWGIIWYKECMVRYSNESFFGILDNHWWKQSETQNVTGNVTQFLDITDDMLINIVNQAAGGGSNIKYGTGAVGYSNLETVYGLVQCTPDLSNYDCKECLVEAIARFPICKGSSLFRPSCNAQFETYPFFNGKATLTGKPPPTSNTTGTGTGTVILSPSSTPSRNSSKSKTSPAKVIAIAVSLALLSAVLVAIIIICFVIRRRKSKPNDAEAHQTGEEDFTTRESLLYDMTTLRTATNDFLNENKLGEGGYGSVYKGTLSNGEEVAVKRLSRRSRKGAQEFKNEILLVAKLHHKNLARLLGFALNENEKLLVYEYVPNKSLDHFVFDPVKQAQLDWRLRYNIILGIAKGMLYLHQDSGLKIIHRDLKASNILLDLDMNPKIADFGLARMFDYDKSQSKTSRLVGTYGYMSPEYVMHGIYSTKSDVYSYGVLVLEIISGKMNSAFPEESYGDNLVTYAWKLWQEGNSLAFVDASIRDSCSSDEVMKCVHLSLLCVQEAVEARPTMATVVLSLESNNNVSLQVPRQPGFFNKTENDPNFGNVIVVTHSSNDVSLSEIEPR